MTSYYLGLFLIVFCSMILVPLIALLVYKIRHPGTGVFFVEHQNISFVPIPPNE